MSLPGANDKCIDSLRLSDWEREALLTQMDKQSSDAFGVELRREERYTYQVSAGMVLKMHHPGGSVANYLVRPRNISVMGLGFLHGNFLYVGSRAGVQLRLPRNGGFTNAAGRIVRCQHVRGHVHEVGMKFDQPVDLALFIENCVRTSGTTEQSIALPQLAGRVLYVEDLVDDQELLEYHLTNLGVEMTTASNGMEALEIMDNQHFDMVVTGVWLPGMSGPEIAQALRDKEYGEPIIGLTSDDSDETREQALASGCTELVHKPYSFDVLIDVLNRYLPSADQPGDEEDLLLSAEWSNSKMRPLILNYISRLERNVRCLQSLLEADDNDSVIQKMCLDVKGSAGGYGFPQVSEVAGELYQLHVDGAEADAMAAKFKELDKLARAACRVRKQANRGQ